MLHRTVEKLESDTNTLHWQALVEPIYGEVVSTCYD